MTVFLTPEGEPFFGGTYYPPEPRHGMPAFRDVLEAISEALPRPPRRRSTARRKQLEEALTRVEPRPRPSTRPADREPALAMRLARSARSSTRSGAGSAARRSSRRPRRSSSCSACTCAATSSALPMVDEDARRDGGGRHVRPRRRRLPPLLRRPHAGSSRTSRRCSTTTRCSPPTYLHGWVVTGEERYRRVVEETLDYVLRELALPEGGLASAQDADTDGVEGLTFTWTAGGGRAAEELLQPFEDGRFVIRGELDEELRRRLFEVREQRPKPARDDKAIASWNGLALAALAEAGRRLDRADCARGGDARSPSSCSARSRTTRAASTAPTARAGRRTPASSRTTPTSRTACYELHVATGELRWLEEANRLARLAVELFGDEERGGFFLTPAHGERLIARQKTFDDNPTPSGNSMLAYVLLRLARIYGDDELERRAVGVFRLIAPALPRAPQAFGHALTALDLHFSPPRELAIVGPPSSEVARAALEPFEPQHGRRRSARRRASRCSRARISSTGRPAVYVCESFACRAPVTRARRSFPKRLQTPNAAGRLHVMMAGMMAEGVGGPSGRSRGAGALGPARRLSGGEAAAVRPRGAADPDAAEHPRPDDRRPDGRVAARDGERQLAARRAGRRPSRTASRPSRSAARRARRTSPASTATTTRSWATPPPSRRLRQARADALEHAARLAAAGRLPDRAPRQVPERLRARRGRSRFRPGWSEWYGSTDPSTYRFYNYTLNENGRLVTYGTGAANYQTDVYSRKAVEHHPRGMRRPRSRSSSPSPSSRRTAAGRAMRTIRRTRRRRRPRRATATSSRTSRCRRRRRSTRRTSPTSPLRSATAADPAGAAERDPRELPAAARVAARRRRGGPRHPLGARGDRRARARHSIVFTADNGFFHGEHRVPDGKVLVYEPSVRVPLIVRGPGRADGRRASEPGRQRRSRRHDPRRRQGSASPPPRRPLAAAVRARPAPSRGPRPPARDPGLQRDPHAASRLRPARERRAGALRPRRGSAPADEPARRSSLRGAEERPRRAAGSASGVRRRRVPAGPGSEPAPPLPERWCEVRSHERQDRRRRARPRRGSRP